MFNCERDPLTLLVELTPRLAKRRYRQSIYEAWNYCCGYCSAPATSLDHIIPKFSSGSRHRNNLIPACRTCNQTKASLNMEEWYRMQDFFDEEKLHKIQEWVKEDMSDLMIYSSSKPQVNLAIS